MIELVGFQYYRERNIIFGTCATCHGIVSAVAGTPTKLTCTCDSTEYRKLPINYLIHNKPGMIIYKLTDSTTEKSFIGVIVTSDTKKPEQKIEEELEYIRVFREFKIDPKLKELLRGSQPEIDVQLLSTPKSFMQAMIEEKLYIRKYQTLKPNGYNQVPILETLMNWNKK